MSWLDGIDWQEILVPDTPVLEIVLRGTVTYLALFILLRLVFKRESAGIRLTDMLVVVLIADAAQNAMAGGYSSVPDGLLLVGVIVAWAALLAWLGHRFPRIRRLLEAPPLPIVEDGRMIPRNMRKELVTEEEVMSQVRLHGLTDLEQVERIYVEADGQFSLIRRDRASASSSPKRKTT